MTDAIATMTSPLPGSQLTDIRALAFSIASTMKVLEEYGERLEAQRQQMLGLMGGVGVDSLTEAGLTFRRQRKASKVVPKVALEKFAPNFLKTTLDLGKVRKAIEAGVKVPARIEPSDEFRLVVKPTGQ